MLLECSDTKTMQMFITNFHETLPKDLITSQQPAAKFGGTFSPWVNLDTGIPVQRATTSAMCCGVTVSTNKGDSVVSSYLTFAKPEKRKSMHKGPSTRGLRNLVKRKDR